MSLAFRRSLVRSGLLFTLLLGAFAIRMPVGHAACAAPQTTIDVERADPGQTLLVVGEYWGTECNDTGSCTSGACGDRCTGLEPSPPATDISIVLAPRGRTPGGRVVLVEGIQANAKLEFTARVDLPDDLPDGRYVIRGLSQTALGPSQPSQSFTVGR